MRVSVIMPVYNTLEYLPEALESLRQQDMPAAQFEVLAIDDGSTDGSGELLDRWAAVHDNVRVVHQANSGWPGMPRNRGLEDSKGQYVFFMDSDDYLGPEALRRLHDFAVAHDSDVVVPKHVGVGGRASSDAPWGTGQVLDADLRKVFLTLMPHKLLRRAFLDEQGLRFPEGKVRLEDGIFVSRAYLTARRVSTLGDYDYYALRQRAAGGNISGGRLEPQSYIGSVTKIISNIRELCADAPLADDLVVLIYRRKALKVFRAERFAAYSPDIQRSWVAAVQTLTREHIPPELQERLDEPQRTQAALARAGDVRGMLDLAKFHLEGGPAMPASPRRRLLNRLGVTPPKATPPGARLQVRLDRAETVPDGLVIRGTARLRGAPPVYLRYVMDVWRLGAPEQPLLQVPVQVGPVDDQGWQPWRARVAPEQAVGLAPGRYRASLRTVRSGLSGRVVVRGADVRTSPSGLDSQARRLTPYVTQGDYLGFKVTSGPPVR